MNQRGNILLFVMVFGAISLSLITLGVAGYGISENHASGFKVNSERAFQISEAGINYYRWHLAHNKDDYTDGTNQPGPYVHDYKNAAGNVIGHFSLNIIAPAPGSTVVTIESTGWVNIQPGTRRTIRVKVAFPAFSDYAFLTNKSAIVDAGETIHGKFHSNGGIEFNGATDAPVTSAASTYTCHKDENRGCAQAGKHPGIWGTGGPTDYWKWPVPSVDLSAIVPKVKQIKDGAHGGAGIFLPHSGKQGWRLQFTSDGNINVYKVLTTKCYQGRKNHKSHYDWFCNDPDSLDTVNVYAMPANGFIYVDDRAWVDGVVNGRATVAVKNDRQLIIDDNITYVAKDGASALGLIGGSNVLISHDAPDNLEINGVILARHGNADRHLFDNNTKSSLTIYGSVIAYGSWRWNWVDDKGKKESGYISSTLTYDSHLYNSPPPGFPYGADYTIVSWEEVH